MQQPAIEARGLRKAYGELEAVKGIHLTVSRGEVFALLGPNGAGKTTTVEILEGHRARTSGEVRVFGHDPGRGERPLRERIGIVLQETGVEPFLTVSEVIDLYRGYYPAPRDRDEIIDVVGLGPQRATRVRRLSGGQQRRLDVAVGLAGDPDLLFLDEPTTGFDPSARRGAWDMIRNLRDRRNTVFLTTHNMDEAQILADRVAIIVNGEIVADGSPADLVARRGETRIAFRLPQGAPVPPGVEPGRADGAVEMLTDDPVVALNRLTSWALDSGVALEHLTVTRASLEDVYLELAGPGVEREVT